MLGPDVAASCKCKYDKEMKCVSTLTPARFENENKGRQAAVWRFAQVGEVLSCDRGMCIKHSRGGCVSMSFYRTQKSSTIQCIRVYSAHKPRVLPERPELQSENACY